jgi:hexosaminidase
MLGAVAALCTLSVGQNPPMPVVVPQPQSMTPVSESFTLNERTAIVYSRVEGEGQGAGRMLQSFLSPATGYQLPIVSRGDKNAIHLRRLKGKSIPDEGYRLSVKSDRVEITASSEAGLFYGAQTLRQLLPAQIYRKGVVKGVDWTVAGVEIEDNPRFRWRGGMLDTGRHFMPKEFVLKFIDLLAMHKMNSFHWHLTDDQGWRIEIKQYPRLTEVGSWRKDTMTKYGNPGEYTGKPHGGYYTQEDIREVVAYAKERHVNVVPEIEMPGHSQAAIAAYPWLGNVPNEQLEVATRWGVIDNVFNTEPETIQFLQNVLVEVMDLFPGQFIHIGGDECPKSEWKASDKAQARIKELGLKDEHGMQSWFISQMDKFIDSKGKRLIGWSEILEGGLAEKAALMVWLGNDGAMEAVSSGHDVVMSQTSHAYLDYYQSRDIKGEPHGIGGYLPIRQVYSYNPVLTQMTADQAKHVLGVQFNLWTEYISNPQHAEYMSYPRACAMAEVGWTDVEKKDFERFEKGLPVHLARLDAYGVNYRKLDPPMAPPVGTWKSGETTETFASRTWDVAARITKSGNYTALFQFTGGDHRLDIEWAELLENGVVVARDNHKGQAGAQNRANSYSFELGSFKLGAKYELRANIRSDAGTDSNGEVFFYPTRVRMF